MTTVLGVHGIFQYKYHQDPGVLAEMWSTALRPAGVEPESFTLAYYAPLLHTVTAMGESALNDLTPAEQALAADWLRQAGVPEAVAQGPLTGWVRDGFDWLIRSGRATGVTRAMARSILAEVATYTDPAKPEPRAAVQESVRDAIRTEQPDIIVAHSLGSVVAYETLWASPDLTVPVLITLGSPLALPPAFYDSFVPDTARAHSRPPGVKRWINFADVGDLVAVPKHLARHFSGIEIDRTITIDAFECHKIGYYLSNEEVKESIRDGLRR